MTTATQDPWAVAEADGTTIVHNLITEGWKQKDIAAAAGISKKYVCYASRGSCSPTHRRRLAKLWCETHGLPEPDIDPIPVPTWLTDAMWRAADNLRHRRFTETPRQQRNITRMDREKPSPKPLAEITGIPRTRIEVILGISHRNQTTTPMIFPEEIDLICCRLGILNQHAYGIPA